MSEYTYPIHISEIQYDTTAEYRKYLRILFNMNPANFPEIANDMDIDEESRDELAYDEIASAKAMDKVYTETSKNKWFQKMYMMGAGKMLSEDPTIGLTILFCYDYLDVFHGCIVEYLKNPAGFDESNIYYQQIIKRLT